MPTPRTERKDDGSTPLTEIALSDRLSAFDERVETLERVRRQLIQDGEEALRDGIKALLPEKLPTGRSGDDSFPYRQYLSLPVQVPKYTYTLPAELKDLIDRLITTDSHGEGRSFTGQIWADLPSRGSDLGVVLGTRDRDGYNLFHVRMHYHSPTVFDISRPSIVTFSGFANEMFKAEVEALKAVKNADPLTQVRLGLGVVKLVSDRKRVY
ncbi:MAG: hypothetical protein HY344_03515 [Candidatus Levybacteria bacterium]|nr:hypothetical protein [Candidatus Levybacteria bacterium]